MDNKRTFKPKQNLPPDILDEVFPKELPYEHSQQAKDIKIQYHLKCIEKRTLIPGMNMAQSIAHHRAQLLAMGYNTQDDAR